MAARKKGIDLKAGAMNAVYSAAGGFAAGYLVNNNIIPFDPKWRAPIVGALGVMLLSMKDPKMQMAGAGIVGSVATEIPQAFGMMAGIGRLSENEIDEMEMALAMAGTNQILTGNDGAQGDYMPSEEIITGMDDVFVMDEY